MVDQVVSHFHGALPDLHMTSAAPADYTGKREGTNRQANVMLSRGSLLVLSSLS